MSATEEDIVKMYKKLHRKEFEERETDEVICDICGYPTKRKAAKIYDYPRPGTIYCYRCRIRYEMQRARYDKWYENKPYEKWEKKKSPEKKRRKWWGIFNGR